MRTMWTHGVTWISASVFAENHEFMPPDMSMKHTKPYYHLSVNYRSSKDDDLKEYQVVNEIFREYTHPL